MEAWNCPSCGASTVIPGQVAPDQLTNGGSRWAAWRFRPSGMRYRGKGLPLACGFLSCWSCGHLWASLAAEELRIFIEERGREVARQHRDASEFGPDHGLPDRPEARRAAQAVSEIDALVLSGRRGEARRQYRQLTRSTWFQAFLALRGWQDLARARKLALFGWSPKDETPTGKGKLTTLGHPLADRSLDG